MRSLYSNCLLLFFFFIYLTMAGCKDDSKGNDSPEIDQTTEAIVEIIDSLNHFSYENYYRNSAEALHATEKALELAQKNGLTDQKAAAYSNKIIIYTHLTRYQEAKSVADSAIFYYQLSENYAGIANVHNRLGNIFYFLSDFDQAEIHYKKAYASFKSLGLIDKSLVSLNNIGLVQTEKGAFNAALETYFQVMTLADSLADMKAQALAMSSIGITYAYMRNFDKAMDYYRQALALHQQNENEFGIGQNLSNIGNVFLSLNNPDSAMNYYMEALAVFRENNDLFHIAAQQTMIGYQYMVQEEPQRALAHFEEAMRFYETTQDDNQQAYLLMNMGIVYRQLKNFDEAVVCLRKSEALYRKMDNPLMLGYNLQAQAELFESNEKPVKALQLFREFQALHDSIQSVEASEKIATAELTYQKRQQQQEIEWLKSKQELQDKLLVSRRNQNIGLFAGFFLVSIFVVLLWLEIKKRKQLNLQLESKNLLIADQLLSLQKMDAAKERFFANISHEFRTPLTLIKGPVEEILLQNETPLSELETEKLRLVLHQTTKLKSLIDQLLELNRIRIGGQLPAGVPVDVGAMATRIADMFLSALKNKHNISIEVVCKIEKAFVRFDPPKLESVLNNLVSNAIKSLGEQGAVQLIVQESQHPLNVDIVVLDDGCGIPGEDLPHIFNRFFSTASHSSVFRESTGIGLEIAREMVLAYGGKIEVKSEPGKGSEFIVSLPLIEPKASEIVKQIDPEVQPASANVSKSPSLPSFDEIQSIRDSQKTVLIVEDHPEMRKYIADHLKGTFNLLEAENGEIGFAMALKHQPDLILSDLMMPVCDGLELLEQVRKEKKLAFSLFVLLTARDDEQSRMQAYKARADEYIIKPFNAAELIERLKALLEQRDLLSDDMSKKILDVNLDDPSLIPADKVFLENLQAIILAQLSNSDFGVDDLASEACLSERQLRRKISQLTGLSPATFIRQLRLLKAKTLLEKKVYNTVAEVAYSVGFTNAQYFSRVYKELFGVRPGDSK